MYKRVLLCPHQILLQNIPVYVTTVCLKSLQFVRTRLHVSVHAFSTSYAKHLLSTGGEKTYIFFKNQRKTSAKISGGLKIQKKNT